MPNEEIKPTIASPSFEQLPQRKRSNLPKIIVGIIILMVVGIGVALAARIWDPVWNPFRPSPEEVIEKMALEMGRLKTVHSKAKIDVVGKEDIKEVFRLSMDFDSDSDSTDLQNLKSAGDFYIALAFEGMEFSLAGESKTIGEDSYFKLTTIPALPFLEPFFEMLGIDLGEIEDQWIKIDQEQLMKILGVSITPEMKEEMQKEKEKQEEMIQKFQTLLKDKKLYIVKREFPDKEIRNVKTYHYLVALNKEEIKKLIPGIFEILYETFPSSNPGFSMTPPVPGKEEILAEILEAFDEFFAKIGEITAQLWIGKKDNLLYKIKGEKEIDLSKFRKSEKGKIIVKFDIDFSDFNQSVKIEKPEEFKTLEEIFSPMFPPMFPPLVPEGLPKIEEEKLPEGVTTTEYEIFSQEVAYRGSSGGLPGHNARLPIRSLFIPQETKIYKIEAYLKAFNRDPTYSRGVGIAVGSDIPEDCQADYYLILGSSATKEKFFTLEPNLFKPGVNFITSWISTYGEWGGIESWVSLKLKIHYSGEAPKLLEGISILTEPIDPIGCRLK